MRFVLFLILAVLAASCRSSQSPQVYLSPEPHDQSGTCYVYEGYRYGDCTALVRRDLLSTKELTQYAYPSSTDARYKPPVRLLDLTKISLDKQITPSFKLDEYLSFSKGRYGFIAEHIFGFMEQVRALLGTTVRITSGYRSPGYNEQTPG